jgi:hypothetical protein
MALTISHDGHTITALDSITRRAPWDACTGAQAVAKRSFIGLPLDAALPASEKRSNCTHLYDLAVLAAAHARDAQPLVYDVLVSDPIAAHADLMLAEIRRNGVAVWQWQMRGQMRETLLLAPAAVAGVKLTELRDWIATLCAPEAEAARMLQWVSMMANVRQSRSSHIGPPPAARQRCYVLGGELASENRKLTVSPRDFSVEGQLPQADATPVAAQP